MASNLLAVDALHDPMGLCIAQPLFRQYWRMDKFNFGVTGRRLKTWHKIQSFQKEVEQPSDVIGLDRICPKFIQNSSSDP